MAHGRVVRGTRIPFFLNHAFDVPVVQFVPSEASEPWVVNWKTYGVMELAN